MTTAKQNGLKSTFYRHKLQESLRYVFGDIETEVVDEFLPDLEWVGIAGGETLFKQGDPGDALYFVLSGRLAAYRSEAESSRKKLGEISRGEVVGEMAIYTDDTRSADVVALRDSLLVKLPQALYESIARKHPEVSIRVTRSIIHRLKHTQRKETFAKPVNICFVPLHEGPDWQALVEKFRAQAQMHGLTYLVDSQGVDDHFDARHQARATKADSDAYYELIQWLNELEYEHEFVLYHADLSLTEWTKRCIRQADQIIFMADATVSPALTATEASCMGQSDVAHTLLLLHPEDTPLPSNTGAWLKERPAISAHYHLRNGHEADTARFIRILTRNAVGLVLAGGAAKGFAHLGVYKALREHGIPVDYLGGTSVGAMIASLIGFDPPMEDLIRHTRDGAFSNPTKDLNFFPLLSLVRGRRMSNMLRDVIYAFTGRLDVDLADTWIPMFLVTSNYTKAREELHTRGDLRKLLQATSAIPGVFPPVVMGNDFLVDGGSFNNFPTDVMSQMGVRKIIGVDFFSEKNYELKITDTPDVYALLLDRFRPKRRRQYRLPSIGSILLNATLLYSYARRKESLDYLDLHFNPQVSKYGFTNWAAFDKIMEEGYRHAKEQLEQLSAEEIADFG